MSDESELVLIETTKFAHIAEYHASVLRAEGINAYVPGSLTADGFAMSQRLLGTLGNDVHVARRDEARARQIVAELQEKHGHGGPPWTCASCGESIDEQFAACWKCSTPRAAEAGA